MTKKNCVHHWKINEYDVGVCKYCREVKDFKALRKGAGDERKEYLLQLRRDNSRRKRGRPRKEARA